VNFDDNFVFPYLCLQLQLYGFFCLLLLDTFFDKVEQLILVSLDLALLFLDLVDFFSELFFNCLAMESQISKLGLEACFHILFFVGLESLKLIERVNKVLVVSAKLLCLALCCQHLNEAIHIRVNLNSTSRRSLKGKTHLSKLYFNTVP